MIRRFLALVAAMLAAFVPAAAFAQDEAATPAPAAPLPLSANADLTQDLEFLPVLAVRGVVSQRVTWSV